MSWFNDQIEERSRRDSEAFENAFEQIAGAVTGKRLNSALNSESEASLNAIEQVLRYYGAKPAEVPEGMTDVNDRLEYLMRPHGIMRRTVKLTKGWHKDAVGAMLAVRAEDGAVTALLPA